VCASDGFTSSGALATDLLVCSLGLQRAAFLLTPHVLPCCGNDAQGAGAPTGALTTCLELHWSGGLQLAVLQQRAPCVHGSQRAFAAELVCWTKAAGFARLVVLAGCEAAAAPAAALHAPFSCLSVLQPPPADWPVLEADAWGGVPLPASVTPPWPVHAAAHKSGVAAHLLLIFAAAGDNSGHAATLATRCAQLLALPLPPGGWTTPASWASADTSSLM
jgi:hypothetical protein